MAQRPICAGRVDLLAKLQFGTRLDAVGLGEFGHRHGLRCAMLTSVSPRLTTCTLGGAGPAQRTATSFGATTAGAAATARGGMINCWPGCSARGPL